MEIPTMYVQAFAGALGIFAILRFAAAFCCVTTKELLLLIFKRSEK